MINHQRMVVCLFVAMALLGMQSCSRSDANQTSQQKIITKAKQATVKYDLTTRSMDCLIYEVQENKFEGKIMVDVREKHGGKCGGDPSTSPRAFSIGFDETTGEIWSDAKSLLGQLEKIGP